MAGALSLARRRFVDGGGVENGEGSALDPEVRDRITATPQPISLAPQPGALSTAQTVPQNSKEQMERIDTATQRLQQQLATDAILRASGASAPILPQSQQPGSSNLPLLAAAGAMLKPTHSGGFSEALGNAFSAAVPVAESERKRLMDAALRSQLLGINQQKADTLQQRADTYANTADGRLAIQQEANRLKALGLDETAAWHTARNTVLSRFASVREGQLDVNRDRAGQSEARNQAQIAYLEAKTRAADNPKTTEASITRDAVESLTSKINPDTGENWTTEDALMHVKGVSQRIAQGVLTGDQRDRSLDMRAQSMLESKEAKEAALALRARLGESAATNNMIASAARIAAQTGKSFQKVLDDVEKGRSGLSLRGPSATPSAPPSGGGAKPDWKSLPDGTPIVQGGVTYIKKGNDPSKWPTQ